MRVEITKGTGPTTVTKVFREDGDVVEPTSVTYQLTNPAGSVVDSGTATKSGSGSSTSFAVVISQADAVNVAELELTWTRADTGATSVDEISIVGAPLFTENDARTFSVVGGLNPLSDTSTYPDAAIAEARYRVTGFLERRCGVSFVRRYARVRCDVPLEDRVMDIELTHGGPGFRKHPRQLLAAAVNGVALSAGELAAVDAFDRGGVRFDRLDGNSWDRRDDDQPRLNVVLEYEYGYSSPPWEAQRAALQLLIASIVPSDVSSRFSHFSNDDGTFRLNLPSMFTPTGMPAVDEFIAAHDERALFS